MTSLAEAGWTPLHDAALRGDVEGVLRAIEDGLAPHAATTHPVLGSAHPGGQLARPKSKTVYATLPPRVEGPATLAFDAGATMLHVAAWAGHRAIAELALARGLKVDAKDDVGATALHHAARGGHDDVVSLLLSRKAKLEASVKNAKSFGFFDQGVTPLFAALEHGHVALARRLVGLGADARIATSNGNTALFFAARGGEVEALPLLAEAGVSLVVPHAYLNDPLLEAVARGHLAMARALIEAGNAPREALLREATARGDDALRAYLLSAGLAPIAYRAPADAARANDPWAIEAMHAAGQDVAAPAVITSALAVGNVRVVELLLSLGARLAADGGAVSPLHMAIEHGHGGLAVQLIERGAPLDAKDPHGNTPLFVASMRRGMEDAIAAMIARGANPYEVMRHGNSAWKVTEGSPRYRALLERTTHVPDPDARGWQPPERSRVLTDPALRPSFKVTYQALFEELVPPRDAAPTVQGELVRVSHKLWDEAMRNGNGNFGARHRAMAEILDLILGPPFEPPRLAAIRDAVRALQKGSLDDDLHRRVAHAVVEWCVAHPELARRP